MMRSREDRLVIYEQMKREIANSAKTQEEYERRVRALANKLNV